MARHSPPGGDQSAQSVEFLDGSTGRLDPTDRGLAYGDGLFETMLAADGRIHWLDYHLDRLLRGCARLGFPQPDRRELSERLTAAAPPEGRAVVKLILTRGSGARGYEPPLAPHCRAIVQVGEAADFAAVQAPVDACTLDLRLGENEALAGIKHLCRIEQVLARVELSRRGYEEGILLNRSGSVVGCTSANIFAVTGVKLLTPEIVTAGIDGVMKRVVMESAPLVGLDIAEVALAPEALREADEAFLTNAVVGVRRIASVDGFAIGKDRIVSRLRSVIAERVNA